MSGVQNLGMSLRSKVNYKDTEMNIISLTSIPPRFHLLFRALDSLKRQRAKIDAIELWVPETYKRFPDFEVSNIIVPDGVVLRRCKEDIGPATKVLPAAMEHRAKKVRIIYCDDDKEFHPSWADSFLEAEKGYLSKGEKNFALAAVGVCIDRYKDAHSKIRFKDRPKRQSPATDYKYRFEKILYQVHKGLGLSSRSRPVRTRWFSSEGRVDVMEGYGGVLVRPEFFLPQDLEIPDPIWRVDDIWLSGLLASRNIPIFANPLARMPRPIQSASHGLAEEVIDNRNRSDLDQLAIRYFQEHAEQWLL